MPYATRIKPKGVNISLCRKTIPMIPSAKAKIVIINTQEEKIINALLKFLRKSNSIPITANGNKK